VTKQREGGPGSGWFAPPKGTHGPGSQGGDPAQTRREKAAAAAKALREKAEALEPSVTKMVQETAEDIGGKMFGLKYRLKSTGSLTRKIHNEAEAEGISTEEAAAKISDTLRYTVLFEPDEYFAGVAHVQSALEGQGWTMYDHKWKNFWQGGDAYDGYNTVLVNEKGQRFELQFHTPESIVIKEQVHKIYEVARELPPGPLRTQLDRQMANHWTGYTRPHNWEKLPGVRIP